MWVQMGAGLVTATLGFTAFSFALRPVAERRRAERFLTIAALLLVGMAVCSVGLVAPVSDGRRQAVRLLIGAQAVCGALAAGSAYRARKRSKRLPVDLYRHRVAFQKEIIAQRLRALPSVFGAVLSVGI